jgi:hypothetical protein
MNIPILILMALGSLLPAQAPAVYPDISGAWRSADGSTVYFHQDGPAVWFDHRSTRFEHHTEGKFLNQNTLRLTEIRRSKAASCITCLKQTCVLNVFGDELRVVSEQLDSNCGLRQGDITRYTLYKAE